MASGVKVHLNTVDFGEFAEGLEEYARKGFYYATRNAFNTLIEVGYTQYRENVQSTYNLKNHWTMGGITRLRARGKSVNTLDAQYGSYHDYLQLHEVGGQAAKSSGYPIATFFSAYNKKGVGARKKVVLARYRSPKFNVPLGGALTTGMRVASIFGAIGAGEGFVGGFQSSARKGVYKVTRMSKSMRRSTGKMLNFSMIWNTEKSTVPVHRKPLMEAANHLLILDIDQVFQENIMRELGRSKLRKLRNGT